MIIDIVLYYVDTLSDIEQSITKVANGLTTKGHKVRVFLASLPDPYEWIYTVPEMHFYAIDYKMRNFGDYGYKYGLRYRRMLQNLGKPDIIIATHQCLMSYICKIALDEDGLRNIPLISWIQDSVDSYGFREFLNHCYSHLALSSQIAEDLSKWIEHEDIYMVGNPVHPERENLTEEEVIDSINNVIMKTYNDYHNIEGDKYDN